MKDLIRTVIAVAILSAIGATTKVIKAANANYQDAIYAASTQGDGTDDSISEIMKNYGFDAEEEPTIFQKVVALTKEDGSKQP